MTARERREVLAAVARDSGFRPTARLCRAFALLGLARLTEKGPRRYHSLTPEGSRVLRELRAEASSSGASP